MNLDSTNRTRNQDAISDGVGSGVAAANPMIAICSILHVCLDIEMITMKVARRQRCFSGRFDRYHGLFSLNTTHMNEQYKIELLQIRWIFWSALQKMPTTSHFPACSGRRFSQISTDGCCMPPEILSQKG